MTSGDNLTIEQAETFAGKRLDRRRKYYLWDFGMGQGLQVCHDCSWLDACSGCHESYMGVTTFGGGYDAKRKIEIGAGCSECGYTGVRRHTMPVPHDMPTEVSA